MKEINEYDSNLDEPEMEICKELHQIINQYLINSTSKLYHSAPVWFIENNPIVGYSKKKEGVALLFWSGQGFSIRGLKPIGKHKAAEIIYQNLQSINKEELAAWLQESIKIQYNYKEIIKNEGEFKLLK